MTLSERNDRIVRILSASLGVAVVAALVLFTRPAGGHGGVLPASLRFALSQDGAVAVTPAASRALLEDDDLRPGSAATGDAVLRNQTGSRLAVGLRAEPSSTALDGITRVRIASAGATIFDSTLQALREGTEKPLQIAPGAAAAVRVRAWIPATEASGYEGRSVDVALALVERPLR